MATVVADTSFLISLFGNDAHTSAAQNWAVHSRQPITVSALNRYELENALRFAAFRRAITLAEAIGSIAAPGNFPSLLGQLGGVSPAPHQRF